MATVAGAWAACIGGSLWQRDIVESGDIEAVRDYAARALRQVRGAAAPVPA